jgi:hypothetical protein
MNTMTTSPRSFLMAVLAALAIGFSSLTLHAQSEAAPLDPEIQAQIEEAVANGDGAAITALANASSPAVAAQIAQVAAAAAQSIAATNPVAAASIAAAASAVAAQPAVIAAAPVVVAQAAASAAAVASTPAVMSAAPAAAASIAVSVTTVVSTPSVANNAAASASVTAVQASVLSVMQTNPSITQDVAAAIMNAQSPQQPAAAADQGGTPPVQQGENSGTPGQGSTPPTSIPSLDVGGSVGVSGSGNQE